VKKIRFQTKQESNKLKEEEFLALSPSERFIHFLKLCEAMAPFAIEKRDEGDNFVIEKKKAS
jgi:hypothetical protein